MSAPIQPPFYICGFASLEKPIRSPSDRKINSRLTFYQHPFSFGFNPDGAMKFDSYEYAFHYLTSSPDLKNSDYDYNVIDSTGRAIGGDGAIVEFFRT